MDPLLGLLMANRVASVLSADDSTLYERLFSAGWMSSFVMGWP